MMACMVRPMKSNLVDLLVSPIDVLGLNIKAENALKRAEITSVMRLIAYNGPDLGHRAHDFGPKKRNEAETALLRHNLRLGIAKDYREQLEAIGPADIKGLRDIATCFARDYKPDVRATKDDKDAMVSTMIDPIKGQLMKAFTPAELQNPETAAIIEESFDIAIRMAQARIAALRP